jgi:4-amino-4-deoxy-L-arabinose transferase-like glycosyltransferase
MDKKTKIILFLILAISFVLRIYNFKSYYLFGHDQDLASWVIKDIVVNHHFRLIGQETSSQGVFIGALYYYLQIPFYMITNMNPIGSIFLSVILGVLTTYSVFFVLKNITNEKVGLIAAFIYSISALIVFTDREVAPTMPVVLWTVWYLYDLFLIYKNEYTKGFVLFGLLIGLVWHLNLALIILSPLALVAFLFSNKKINMKPVALGIITLVVTLSPFLMFEYRHNFSQTKAIYLSLTTEKDSKIKGASRLDKLDRVMQLVHKNTIGIFSKHNFIRPSSITLLLVASFIYLVRKNKINRFWSVIFVLWQILYIGFFSLNALNPSEYYFNGMNIVWILIASMIFLELSKNKNIRSILYILVALFVFTNFDFILRYNTDKKGYIEKMSLVQHIKEDSLKHGYPCVSISYITSPGYDLGYRYLFYLNNMHVNKPISNSPVYTIVFPLELVDRVDTTFGSLGLIYPDYSRYNEKDVNQSCKGDNSNLTEPMLGYTQ